MARPCPQSLRDARTSGWLTIESYTNTRCATLSSASSRPVPKVVHEARVRRLLHMLHLTPTMPCEAGMSKWIAQCLRGACASRGTHTSWWLCSACTLDSGHAHVHCTSGTSWPSLFRGSRAGHRYNPSYCESGAPPLTAAIESALVSTSEPTSTALRSQMSTYHCSAVSRGVELHRSSRSAGTCGRARQRTSA